MLLTTGCKPVAHSNTMNSEIRTFYSGLLNGEEISVTQNDRDYKTVFFKENNKNFHKKEFAEVDRYAKQNNLDIAYTLKNDNKISRYYRGNSKISNKGIMKYYLIISVSTSNLQDPRVEKYLIMLKDDKDTKIQPEITVLDNEYQIKLINSDTSKIYKEFDYTFTNNSASS